MKDETPASHRVPSTLVGLLLATLVGPTIGASAGGACPDLSGHYQVAGDAGPGRGDALDALRLAMAGFIGSQVRVEGPSAGGLRFYVKSGTSGAMSKQPLVVLQPGADYRCRDGVVVLTREVQAERHNDQGDFVGRSTVTLAPARPRGLAIVTTFNGRRYHYIPFYDSANVKIPKPGTGRSFHDAMRWPDIGEAPPPMPPSAMRPPAEPPEAPELQAVRRRLGHEVLGGVQLLGLKAQGGEVVASLRAQRSDDIVRFEDRLTGGGTVYRTTRSPLWSNNTWAFEIALRLSEGGGRARASRPSNLRIEHELRFLRPPGVDVRDVTDTGDAYIATLVLIGDGSPEQMAARLREHSRLIGDLVVLETAEPARIGTVRTARVTLQLR